VKNREKHENSRFLGISRKCPFSMSHLCSNFAENAAFFEGRGLQPSFSTRLGAKSEK